MRLAAALLALGLSLDALACGEVISVQTHDSSTTRYALMIPQSAISAANAAGRLKGGAAPDGVVLTSPVTVGSARARLPWTAQTVHDTPLEEIRVPVLLVGHAADACLRSPAGELAGLARRLKAPRVQSVTVSGGQY